MTPATRPPRRFWQFRLATLLLLVLTMALTLAWRRELSLRRAAVDRWEVAVNRVLSASVHES
jgi:hypothetical protein